MKLFSLRLLASTCNKDLENIIIAIKSKALVNRINMMLVGAEHSNPDKTIFVTVSGAKTSDFIAVVDINDKHANFGEDGPWGIWEIVDDTTFSWYPPKGQWNTTLLTKVKQGIKFLVKGYLENQTVELS